MALYSRAPSLGEMPLVSMLSSSAWLPLRLTLLVPVIAPVPHVYWPPSAGPPSDQLLASPLSWSVDQTSTGCGALGRSGVCAPPPVVIGRSPSTIGSQAARLASATSVRSRESGTFALSARPA